MAWLFAVCLSLWSGALHAHLLPKQNATINIVEQTAYLVVSVPVTALKGLDDDENGSLSLQEIQNHTKDIEQQVASRLRVVAGDLVGIAVLTMVMAPHTDGSSHESDYVVVLHRVDFAAPPMQPRLETDLFGTKQGESQMTITATRGKESEVAILELGTSSYTFFRGRWQTFCHFVRIGTTHILGGLDHLLFLLTLIIGAASWRYWLAVVTSFTLAHSLTLSLSALNLLRLPSTIVEPGIAASIVLMALLALRDLRKARTQEYRRRLMPVVAIVFACGLLHGFGFASAIGAISKDTGSRLVTLAGFNLGIELGQCLFLAGAMLVFKVLANSRHAVLVEKLPKITASCSAVAGCFLLVQLCVH
jgi:hydrogenase/urease accessory protein HupE